MRSVVLAAVVVSALLGAGLLSRAPSGAVAENHGTPSPAASPTAGPAEVCTPIEIDRGDLVGYMPAGMLEGAVRLHTGVGTPVPQEALFLTVLTLPPTSCMDFRVRSGAVVLFVQEGSVEYTAHALNPDPALAPNIQMGDSGGTNTPTPVPLDSATTLHATDWLTQDRPVWFTFRNAGAVDAVVSVAAYAVPWFGDDGGCPCRRP
jgi:hypothetical protein